jgi:hypothetical protein
LTVRFADQNFSQWTANDTHRVLGNMAAALDVALSRLRVDAVRAGSVIVDVTVMGYATQQQADAAHASVVADGISFDADLGPSTAAALSAPVPTRLFLLFAELF